MSYLWNDPDQAEAHDPRVRMDIWDEGNDGGDGASGPDRWGVGLAAAGGALIWAAVLYLAAHVIWALVR